MDEIIEKLRDKDEKAAYEFASMSPLIKKDIEALMAVVK